MTTSLVPMRGRTAKTGAGSKGGGSWEQGAEGQEQGAGSRGAGAGSKGGREQEDSTPPVHPLTYRPQISTTTD